MSTWQVLSCDGVPGDNYRWELSLHESQLHGGVERNPSSSSSSAILPSSMSDIVRQGFSKLLDGGEQKDGIPPIFRTGSGKSVPLKRSSLAKALSILDDCGDAETLPCSGLQDCRQSSSSTLFQTGSGKTICASSASTDRAKRLLGLEGDVECNPFQVAAGTINIIDVIADNILEVSPQIVRPCASVHNVSETTSHAPMPSTFLTSEAGLHSALDSSCYATMKELQMNNLPPKSSPIKFQTAGGRSISISGDARKRARSLLGDPEIGGLLKREKLEGSSVSLSYHGKSCDSLSSKENCPPNFSAHPELPKRHDKLKSFVSPLRPSFNQMDLSNTSERLRCSNNVTQQFDAAFHKNALRNSRKQFARGSSQDISNKYGVICSSRVHVGGESRKIGQTYSSSPTGTKNITDVSADNLLDVSPQIIRAYASVHNVSDTTSHAPMPSTFLNCEAGLHSALDASCNTTMKELQMNNLPPKSSPIKFQTAGGRSISLSGDALKRARSLLGDPEMGGLLKRKSIEASSVSLSYPGKSCDSLSSKENCSTNFSAHPELPKRHDKLKSFVSPLRPSFNEMDLSNTSERLSCSNNMSQEFDTVFHKTAHGNSRKQFARGSSQDISNKYGVICSSRVHVGGESRKIGQTYTSSPTGTKNITDVSADNLLEVSPQIIRPCASVHNVNDTTSHAPMPSTFLTCEAGLHSALDASCYATMKELQMNNLPPKSSPIKFQTAGGRSISLSGDALKRARSLLGDPEMGGLLKRKNIEASSVSLSYPGKSCDSLSSKENCSPNFSAHPELPKRHDKLKSFVSPLRPSFNQMDLSNTSERLSCSNNMAQQFDTAFHKTAHGNSRKQFARGSSQDISNKYGVICSSRVHVGGESRKIRQTYTSSPFKMPRSSKFLAPLKSTISSSLSGISTSFDHHLSKEKVPARFPPLLVRAYVKEYFDGPPLGHKSGATSSVRSIGPGNAENFMLPGASGFKFVGFGDFFQMLVQSGATSHQISDLWVRNHFRWIIWKLASYERCYPAACSGKFLTIANVLEELKYRYEREINHGQRSAIKRILEGDASPAKMLVLCVSAIHFHEASEMEASSISIREAKDESRKRIELTDGWYSLDAILDEPLSKYLTNEKIFVGQKIRICGAGLHGWSGPISPLQERGSVSFLLHANGTYRAHWADRLGFYKGIPLPLSFRCIKSNGGQIPLTLVGVSRIYPILYRERICGSSIVRSENMELNMRQSHHKKRSMIVDAVISEYEKNNQDVYYCSDSDSEEGAKILQMLENSAEPEVLMAQMNAAQLTSFSSYRSKLDVSKQNHLDKLIENALRDAGITEREVTPFMRVRVVGLNRRDFPGEHSYDEGFITIWEPTDSQQHDVVEGKAYAISSLIPVYYNSDTLYLHAKGSTSKWRPLSLLECESFRPFFNPRRNISLSHLGEIPFSSEFDVAAFVLYVGEVHERAQRKQQWVFVTDGTKNDLHTSESGISVLAISFTSPLSDDLTLAPINSNLAGSTVCFCNLFKRADDQINHLWVAEAAENSIYFLNFDVSYCKHLKGAAMSVEQWGSMSELAIKKLRERVSIIIGDGRS